MFLFTSAQYNKYRRCKGKKTSSYGLVNSALNEIRIVWVGKRKKKIEK